MTPQIDLREKLDLYAGPCRIKLFHGSDTPLKGYQAGEIDLVIVRENTEGLFSARLSNQPTKDEGARCTQAYPKRLRARDPFRL